MIMTDKGGSNVCGLPMKYRLCWCVLLAACLLLVLPAFADDADEDDGGGKVLNPALQWQLADASWGRREYDDAAALMTTFANANPDHENALEALWRVYLVYTDHRPNPQRRKEAYQAATTACERWEQKYTEKDKLRLAQSYWYRAVLQERQGDRPGGIRFLQDLINKASGTAVDAPAYWTLAEWLNRAGRYQEAIPQYAAYRQTVGVTDQAALSCFRQAFCHLQLKDNASAIDVYKEVLDGKYNWNWASVYNNVIDVARQLRAIGEDQLARAYALKLLEKGPKRENLQKAAGLFLGENVSKRIIISPECYDYYSTTNLNIDGNSKLDHLFNMDLVVRLTFVTKDDPFEGTLKVTPKQTMTQLPANMKIVDVDGRKVCTAEFKAPDEKGNVPADVRYKFAGGATPPESPTDNLTVTRKWDKRGNTWGESAIRVQTTARWDLSITLPNGKTNANNITPRPYSITNNGKTFVWPYYCYDAAQGITIKLPVEVDGTVQEYYPAVTLSRGTTSPYADKQGDTANPELDFRWFNITMTAPKAFLSSFFGPARLMVTLQEVSR